MSDANNRNVNHTNLNSDEFDFDSQYAMEKYMANYFDRTETINNLFKKDDSKHVKKEQKKDANGETTGILGKLKSLFR